MLELKYIYLSILTLIVLWIISSYLRTYKKREYKKVQALKKLEQKDPVMVQGGFSHPLYLSSMIPTEYVEAGKPPLIFKMNT